MPKRGTGLVAQMTMAALLGAAGVVALSSDMSSLSAMATSIAAHASGSCNIKGNVSRNSGERIYHVPGQRYYAETRVDGRYGERWFCSEREARQAGWRRSRV